MQTVKVNDTEYRLKQTKVTRREEEFGHSYWSEDHGWLIGVTTILSSTIPPDQGLIEYFKRGDKFEMEEYLNETSAQGTRVHQAAELLLMGETVNSKELLTLKEKKCIAAFIEWFRIWQPEETMSEQVVAYILEREGQENIRYAGTLDILCKVQGVWCVIDIKTGRQVDLQHGLQIRSYGEAVNQSLVDDDGKPIVVEKYFTLYVGTAHRTQGKKTNTLGLQTTGLGWCTIESNYSFEDVVRVYDFMLFLNGGYPEPPKVQVFPEEFKLLEEVK